MKFLKLNDTTREEILAYGLNSSTGQPYEQIFDGEKDLILYANPDRALYMSGFTDSLITSFRGTCCRGKFLNKFKATITVLRFIWLGKNLGE